NGGILGPDPFFDVPAVCPAESFRVPGASRFGGEIFTGDGAVTVAGILTGAPPNRQGALSWRLQLPTSPQPGLSFFAGYILDANYWPFELSVRVNGNVMWRDAKKNRENVGLDLSPWSGQSILLEWVESRGLPRGNGIGAYPGMDGPLIDTIPNVKC